MEAFSLLKYWRVGTGSNGGVSKTTEKQQQQQQPVTTTIATTVSEMSVEEEAEECVVDGDADDEGPFFDLEFAVPDEDEEEDDNNGGEKEKDDDYDDGDSVTTDEDEEDGFDFTVSPGSVSSGGNQIDSSSSPNNLTFSPSDDIFFKGDGGKSVSPLFQSSSSTTSSSSSSVENSNPKVQFPVSLIKTATKIRVFMLGFKSNNNSSSNPKPKPEEQKPEEKQSTIRTELKQSKKFVTVKFRVDELLPMISLFTRDSSSSSAANSNNKITASSHEEIEVEDEEGKKLVSKDVVQKYLKMIKPLYVRVSKRYNNNNGGGSFSPSRSMDNSSVIPPSPLPVKIEDEISLKRKQGVGNLPNGLRIVRKHLGKSRSASSVNPVTTNSSGGIQAKRRDDSLLQQQDGIQSAILHCKRSFNSSRDTDSCPRSSTESHEISIDSTRTSIDETAAVK